MEKKKDKKGQKQIGYIVNPIQRCLVLTQNSKLVFSPASGIKVLLSIQFLSKL